MNLQTVLLFGLFCYVACEYKCSESDCHECEGDTCQLTCQGIDCNTCPNGECCNSQNCNACVRSICCETKKCNECITRRRKLCLNETTDASKCDAVIENMCGLAVDKVVFENGLTGLTMNQNHHNVTTKIKIINLINTTNLVDMPLQVNITNREDILSKSRFRGGLRRRVLVGQSPGPVPRTWRKCCSVVHPQECHTVPGLPNSICYTRRHTECSNICSNSTHLVIKHDNRGINRCIVISVHPFYYCGYFSIVDCSACYNCGDKDEIECLNDNYSCSDFCRLSVLPRRFYNVPYFIRTAGKQDSSEDETTNQKQDTAEGSRIPEAQR